MKQSNMMKMTKRTLREMKTVEEMIKLYCHNHHYTKGNELCDDCKALKDYAFKRINNCVFNPDKPTCKNCTIHCYSAKNKEAIRQVMRFSGPRMMLKFPGMTILHLIDGMRDNNRIAKFLEAKEKRNSK